MLPIECKKRHPDFVNWVFFPASATSPSVPMVRVHQTDGKSLGSLIVPKVLRTDLIIADEARETKGDYLKVKEGDRTKTANTAITEASAQVTIATQFLLTQEKRIMDQKTRNINNGTPPMSRQTFLPMIVTTAHLFTCNFQDADVGLETGEIPLSRASLTGCPYLLYNYPVPYASQYMPEIDTRERLEQQAYMPILVVESTSFPDILEKLKNFEVTGNALNLFIGAGVEP